MSGSHQPIMGSSSRLSVSDTMTQLKELIVAGRSKAKEKQPSFDPFVYHDDLPTLDDRVNVLFAYADRPRIMKIVELSNAGFGESWGTLSDRDKVKTIKTHLTRLALSSSDFGESQSVRKLSDSLLEPTVINSTYFFLAAAAGLLPSPTSVEAHRQAIRSNCHLITISTVSVSNPDGQMLPARGFVVLASRLESHLRVLNRFATAAPGPPEADIPEADLDRHWEQVADLCTILSALLAGADRSCMEDVFSPGSRAASDQPEVWATDPGLAREARAPLPGRTRSLFIILAEALIVQSSVRSRAPGSGSSPQSASRRYPDSMPLRRVLFLLRALLHASFGQHAGEWSHLMDHARMRAGLAPRRRVEAPPGTSTTMCECLALPASAALDHASPVVRPALGVYTKNSRRERVRFAQVTAARFYGVEPPPGPNDQGTPVADQLLEQHCLCVALGRRGCTHCPERCGGGVFRDPLYATLPRSVQVSLATLARNQYTSLHSLTIENFLRNLRNASSENAPLPEPSDQYSGHLPFAAPWWEGLVPPRPTGAAAGPSGRSLMAERLDALHTFFSQLIPFAPGLIVLLETLLLASLPSTTSYVNDSNIMGELRYARRHSIFTGERGDAGTGGGSSGGSGFGGSGSSSNSGSFQGSLPDMVDELRQRELVAYATTGLLLTLLKLAKISHGLLFEYFTHMLVKNNGILLVIKFLRQNMGTYITSKGDIPELNFLNISTNWEGTYSKSCWAEDGSGSGSVVPSSSSPLTVGGASRGNSINLTGIPANLASGVANRSRGNSLSLTGGLPLNLMSAAAAAAAAPAPAAASAMRNQYVSFRNASTVLVLLRLLQKMTKNQPARIALLYQTKVDDVLRRLLKLPVILSFSPYTRRRGPRPGMEAAEGGSAPDSPADATSAVAAPTTAESSAGDAPAASTTTASPFERYALKIILSMLPLLGRTWVHQHMRILSGVFYNVPMRLGVERVLFCAPAGGIGVPGLNDSQRRQLDTLELAHTLQTYLYDSDPDGERVYDEMLDLPDWEDGTPSADPVDDPDNLKSLAALYAAALERDYLIGVENAGMGHTLTAHLPSADAAAAAIPGGPAGQADMLSLDEFMGSGIGTGEESVNLTASTDSSFQLDRMLADMPDLDEADMMASMAAGGGDLELWLEREVFAGAYSAEWAQFLHGQPADGAGGGLAAMALRPGIDLSELPPDPQQAAWNRVV
ncbi:hypothetical protein H696_01057 [Fonticula alba]|uniref:Far11/STRP C-terminal domain-containing protein n=1 Tax=Fonticula alba TaxID=691883 RepID=A0A058ZB40_FONAL|nr:hypothetical protein H696_01057 [Fonticula alba]KCV71640.1 hypothetical protein H696_01057 [Fonticula alba]|eukprot:XP_009493218.1 hypothetical protein H696_01057 [Fonticula alba]